MPVRAARVKVPPAPKKKNARTVQVPRAKGMAQAPLTPAKVTGKAASDPRFQKVMTRIDQSAAKIKTHPSPAQKASEAQAAAQSPANERLAGAQANQVDSMKDAKTGKPDSGGFLAMLRAEIEKIMPKNLDESDKFMEGGEKEQMKGAVSGNVGEQRDQAAGPLQATTAQAPDPASVPGRQAEAMPAEPQTAPPAVNTAEAMPAPKPADEIAKPGEAAKKDADKQMKDAELTPDQLKKANDPRFSAVIAKKGTVEATAAAGTGKYKANEQKVLSVAASGAAAQGKQSLMAFAAVKQGAGAKVLTRQQAAKLRDEARRAEVVANIEKMFARTKLAVEAKLSRLDGEVSSLFDRGADAALNAMKTNSKREIDKFKDERYSGVTGAGRWIADQFRPVPPEIKRILERARGAFSAQMDALIVQITNLVETRLAEAKAEIDRGQAAIKAYVAKLPADLQAVGRQAQSDVAGRFDELRRGVDDKKQELASKLAERYKKASEDADAALKKIEEENKGALSGLVAAIGEVLKVLTEFKDKLMSMLRKAQSAIKLIVADPIGFLKNLLAAIKGGFNKFIDNIGTHLKNAFMKWLFGSLADAGIELPKDLSLPSILKLVLGVLGITYDRMRAKAVKLIGERNVKIIEKAVEYVKALITGGPAALWEKVKEDLGNLKAMVIDAIQDWLITTLIKKAVTKIVSMFNPVGAIIQAIITIYDVVIFVVEKAKQIMAFIEAVVNSVYNIATGAIGGAIAWIEKSLANILPLLIGFLAQLIGLGGISAKIKEFIKKIQDKVDKAIDKVIAKVVDTVKKLFGKDGKNKSPDQRTDQQKQRDLDSAISDAQTLLADKKNAPSTVSAKLPALKTKYKLNTLELVKDTSEKTSEEYHVQGEVNPNKKSTKVKKSKVAPEFKIKIDFNNVQQQERQFTARGMPAMLRDVGAGGAFNKPELKDATVTFEFTREVTLPSGRRGGSERQVPRPGLVGLPGQQRLHGFGHGFGAEARFVTYGPAQVNQQLQNEGLEAAIRFVKYGPRGLGPKLRGLEGKLGKPYEAYKDVKLIVTVQVVTQPGSLRTQSVTYVIKTQQPGEQKPTKQGEITINVSGDIKNPSYSFEATSPPEAPSTMGQEMYQAIINTVKTTLTEVGDRDERGKAS
jgi:hypothetical protein